MNLLAKYEQYGLLGSLRLFRDIVITRVFFRGARIVRYPFRCRGRNAIQIGVGLTCGVDARIDAFPESERIVLWIGSDVQLNDHVHIAAIQSVFIGDHALIASRVFISDHNHGRFDGNNPEDGPDVPPVMRPLSSKPVRIGSNVWIGESVCVMPGVTIGNGAVIGAGSVVTRDVPENCVAAGNPARVIRRFDSATHEWKRV